MAMRLRKAFKTEWVNHLRYLTRPEAVSTCFMISKFTISEKDVTLK